MLIAVPGWPLPTFWTASIARTRTVSMARRSRSPKPSGRVGCGWRGEAGGGGGGGGGEPVGASLAASAGASDAVLCVPMWLLAPRVGLGTCVGPSGGRCERSRADDGARSGGSLAPSPSSAPYPLHAQHQRDQTLVIPARAATG